MKAKDPKLSAQMLALRKRIGGILFPQPHLRRLLDGIEHASVFVKSADGTLMFGNQSLIRHLGLSDETQLLGLTDRQLFPAHLAEKYRQDDLEVIQSGREKLNLIEMFKNEQGLLQWYVTHKYPVLDRGGRVIGIMGTIQEHGAAHAAARGGDTNILAAAEYIEKNFRNPISLERLSRLSAMPARQFQRKFKLAFGVSPREYIIRHRIRHACEALRNSRKGIVKVSAEAGFYDQSSFTRQFRSYMHTTPLKYRKGADVTP